MLAALVLLLLGRPARVSDRVDYSGLQFWVRTVKNRGVRRCLVKRAGVAAEPAAVAQE